MANGEIEKVLARRLPTVPEDERKRLATSYLDGVRNHATARTTGTGPVPTTLATERAELLAFVSREMERLLTEDEIAALLRITTSAARSVRKTMLAVYDDLPVLALKSAFSGARRGRVLDDRPVRDWNRDLQHVDCAALRTRASTPQPLVVPRVSSSVYPEATQLGR